MNIVGPGMMLKKERWKQSGIYYSWPYGERKSCLGL